MFLRGLQRDIHTPFTATLDDFPASHPKGEYQCGSKVVNLLYCIRLMQCPMIPGHMMQLKVKWYESIDKSWWVHTFVTVLPVKPPFERGFFRRKFLLEYFGRFGRKVRMVLYRFSFHSVTLFCLGYLNVDVQCAMNSTLYTHVHCCTKIVKYF